MPFSLTILRTYASSDPATLPPTVLLRSSDANIVIWDKFPKAMFHFLVLPRIRPPLTEQNASNLSSLIRWDKKKAHECLLQMKSDAEEVKVMIEDEMVSRVSLPAVANSRTYLYVSRSSVSLLGEESRVFVGYMDGLSCHSFHGVCSDCFPAEMEVVDEHIR